MRLRDSEVGRAAFQLRESFAQAGDQVLAHAEQGVAGAHHHAADGDRAYDVAPHRGGKSDPAFVGGVGGQKGLQLRTQKEHQQWNHQSPNQHAAGKIERRQLRADNVAHPDERRADGGRGNRRDAARAQDVPGSQRAQPERAQAEAPHAEEEVAVRGEALEDAGQIDGRAETHVIEKILGGAGAGLSGLMNLSGRHRFGERQLRIFHHHAPNEGDEQNPQHGADNHERGGFEIRRVGGQGPHAGPKAEVFGNHGRRPNVRDEKGRQGEDRAGGHRFADGAGGARDVLLQDGAFDQAQHRHADDRGRISGGDGLAGAQTEIRIGRAQNHGHRQAQQNGARRQLAHFDVFRHERPVFDGRHCSRALTFSLSDFPSTVLPASFAWAAFMTTPICFNEVTPVSESAAAIAASISASVAPAGR